MKLFYIIFLQYIFISIPTLAKETWILDKDLSAIQFELPILFANNVKGEFNKIEGLVEIDLDKKKQNKAIFSVDIKSIDINYNKYKTLLLSNIFFDVKKFPIALVDTRKFSYQDKNKINLDIELTIKGISHSIPLSLEIIPLTKELIQLKGELKFSRTKFQIGTGKWSNTSILKNKVKIYINLFLYKA